MQRRATQPEHRFGVYVKFKCSRMTSSIDQNKLLRKLLVNKSLTEIPRTEKPENVT